MISLGDDPAANGIEFGASPISIGSASDCDVRLEPSEEIAPHHALVWVRDGKLMLRHVGDPALRPEGWAPVL